MDFEDTHTLAGNFFRYCGMDCDSWLSSWCKQEFKESMPASAVVSRCTDVVVERIVSDTF